MAQPLELSYNWRTPTVVATLAAIACVGVLLRGRADGWIPVAAIVIAIWALFLWIMVRRARSYLMVDGSALVLRPWRAYVRVEGSQVRAVRRVLTSRGPSYRLLVALPDGRTARYLAPTAWLRGGHAALFSWLLSHAPDAKLDKGSRASLELLRNRGMISDAP